MACENEYEENLENLMKFFSVQNIVSFNIKHIKCSAGSSSGDNYMSVVKRLKIHGHSNTNEQKEGMNLIVKYFECISLFYVFFANFLKKIIDN